MDFFKNLLEQWKHFSSTRKTVSLVITACFILAVIFFYRWATKVEYATLYTNVQPESAGKIVEGLKALNVPYTLTDDGKAISIPKDQVYEVRLSLASTGIVAENGKGFELFDASNMGATDFEINVNYQRALQEELRRSIVQIDAVKQARVHLVLPEKSAFIDNQSQPQASIILELKPLATLQPEQVRGIAELVAGSVENLSYKNVNIIDTEGHVLSDQITAQGSNASELNQLGLRKSFENDLENRIQKLLEKIYGTNKIVVMVTADLDFNQKEASRIIWGDQGVVESEQNNQTQTGNGQASGLAGTSSNTESESSGNTGTNNVNTSTSSTKNYEINKVEEKEIYAPGRIKSISVAVAVDGNPGTTETNRIKSVVTAAIGLDSKRGDTLDVMGTKFDKSSINEAKAEMAKADETAQKKEKIDTWMSWGFKGAGVIALLILGILLLRYLRPRDNWPELNIDQPVSVKSVEEKIEQSDGYSSEDDEVKSIVESDPEVAVQIIKSWLDESGSAKNG
jgi:flagellar M-ring protein FliF